MKTARFSWGWAPLAGVLVGLWLGARSPAIGGDLDPMLVGSWQSPAEYVVKVAMWGNYALVTRGWGGLLVLDLADPQTPRWVGELATPQQALEIKARGNFAYVSVYARGLDVIDVSDPSAPRKVGGYETPYVNGVAFSGDYAFLAAGGVGSAGLIVLDISDPANPVEQAKAVLGSESLAIAIAGQYAVVTDYDGTLSVVDISVPTDPRRVGLYTGPSGWSGHAVAIAGGYAYVGALGVDVIDISDPTAPSLVGSYAGDTVNAVLVSGDRLYVARGDHNLQILDVRDPTSPKRVGVWDTDTRTGNGSAFGLASLGDDIVVAAWFAGLQVVNPNRSARLQRVGATGGFRVREGQGLAIADRRAYMTSSWWDESSRADRSQLRVLDLTDVTHPTELGAYEAGGDFRGLAVSGDYAYVPVMDSGPEGPIRRLEIFDVSDPAAVAPVGGCDLEGFFYGVALAGDYALVAEESKGLLTVDVTDPAQPRWVGQGADGQAKDVTVQGDFAYVAAWSGGLSVYNVSDPVHPQRVGNCDIEGQANGVEVSGRYAFVAKDRTGLRVIDIANPTAPRLVGGYDTGRSTLGVSLMGRYACLADGYLGMVILDVSNPLDPSEVAKSSAFPANRVVGWGRSWVVAAGQDGLVTANMFPEFSSIARSGAGLELAWEGYGPARLQRSDVVANAEWLDLEGLSETNRASLPFGGRTGFFRLIKP